MSEEKKNIFSSINAGNVIALVVIIGGIFSTWVGIKSHMDDDSLHVNEEERILSEKQLNQLILWSDEFPDIKKNEESINKIILKHADLKKDYDYLRKSHEELKAKQSRNYKELNDEIKNLHE